MLRVWTAILLTLPVHAADLPFWKAKEKVYSRVQNGEVIVSVKSTPDAGSHKHLLVLVGGGWIRARLGFVEGFVSDYGRVTKLCPFVTDANFSKNENLLHVKLSAFGRKADLDLKVQSLSSGEAGLKFEIVKGVMTGLSSTLLWSAVDHGRQTEVDWRGSYGYDTFPIPQWFLEFGMEVMFKRMALRLRDRVQEAAAMKKETM